MKWFRGLDIISDDEKLDIISEDKELDIFSEDKELDIIPDDDEGPAQDDGLPDHQRTSVDQS